MDQQRTQVPMDLQPAADDSGSNSDNETTDSSSDSEPEEDFTQLSPEEMQRRLKQLWAANKKRKRENKELKQQLRMTFPLAASYPHLIPAATHRLQHLDPHIIEEIRQHFLIAECGSRAANATPELDRLTVIYSPTQSGKSAETVALVWINFFRYGIASYLFLRGEASEYGDFGRSVLAFNAKLREFITRKWPDGECDPELYMIEYAPLNGVVKQLKPEDLVVEGNLTNPRLKCILRARLLTAGNVQKAAQEMSVLISQFGVNKAGHPNACVLVDECQDLFQSSTQESIALERAFFQDRTITQAFRRKCSDFLKGLSLDEQYTREVLRSFDNITPSTFRGYFQLVCISATPFSAILAEEHRKVQFVHCNVTEDYIGWGKIPVRSVEELLQDGAPPAAGYVRFAAETSRRLLMQDRDKFGHYIYFWPQRSPKRPNSEYDEAAEAITDAGNEYDRPVFVVLNYASSTTRHQYGSAIYMNRTAYEKFKQQLDNGLDLDAEWFITRTEYKDYTGGTQSSRCGKTVIVDGVERMVVNKRLGSGYKHSQDFFFEDRQGNDGEVCGGVLYLPRSNNYRVRTQLSIVERVCTQAGVPKDEVWIATIGGALMKAGKPIKTIKHSWAATGMVAVMDDVRFAVLSFVELIQGIGRVTGRREGGDPCPVLYMQSSASVKEKWSQMAAFSSEYWTHFSEVSQTMPDATIQEILSHPSFQNVRPPEVPHMLQAKKFSPLPLPKMPFLYYCFHVEDMTQELLNHPTFRDAISCISQWPDETRKLLVQVLTFLQRQNEDCDTEDGMVLSRQDIWNGMYELRELVNEDQETFDLLFDLLHNAAASHASSSDNRQLTVLDGQSEQGGQGGQGGQDEQDEILWISTSTPTGRRNADTASDDDDDGTEFELDESTDIDACLLVGRAPNGELTLQLDPVNQWLIERLQFVCRCTPLASEELKAAARMTTCSVCKWAYHSCCADQEITGRRCSTCSQESQYNAQYDALRNAVHSHHGAACLDQSNEKGLLHLLGEVIKARHSLDGRRYPILKPENLKRALCELLNASTPIATNVLGYFHHLVDVSRREMGLSARASDEQIVSRLGSKRDWVGSPTLLKALFCDISIRVGAADLLAEMAFIEDRVIDLETFAARHADGLLFGGETYFVYQAQNDVCCVVPVRLRKNVLGQLRSSSPPRTPAGDGTCNDSSPPSSAKRRKQYPLTPKVLAPTSLDAAFSGSSSSSYTSPPASPTAQPFSATPSLPGPQPRAEDHMLRPAAIDATPSSSSGNLIARFQTFRLSSPSRPTAPHATSATTMESDSSSGTFALGPVRNQALV